MWYLVLNFVVAVWVFFDARSRRMNQSLLWAIGTIFLMIFVIPFYLAKRPLKEGEMREGGTSWNVIKNFAIFWTLSMFVAGLLGVIVVVDVSAYTDPFAAIGTAIGLSMIFGLWLVVMVAALLIGLFLKQSSNVERGPTGALALNIDESQTPDINHWTLEKHIAVIFVISILLIFAIILFNSLYKEKISKPEVINEQQQVPSTTMEEISSPLDKYVGYNIHEMFDKEPSIVSKFQSLLSENYDAFYSRLGTSGNLNLKGDFYVGSGLMPHEGGSNEAAFAINKKSEEMYLCNAH